MDDLFSTLAGYLNFVIDLLTLSSVEEYSRLDLVNADLVSFFLTGVIFGFVISYSHRVRMMIPPSDVRTPAGRHAQEPPQGSVTAVPGTDSASSLIAPTVVDILGVVAISFVAVLVYHGALEAWHWARPTQDMGTFKDTLNAYLGFAAIFFVANSAMQRVQRKLDDWPFAALIVSVVFLVVHTYPTIVFVALLATVHGTTFASGAVRGPVSCWLRARRDQCADALHGAGGVGRRARVTRHITVG